MSTLAALSAVASVRGDEWKNGVSLDSVGIRDRLMDAHRHLAQPVSRQTVQDMFGELAATWKADTMFESSASALVSHPSYQRIIGLGREAVPLLLRSLKASPDHWFAALSAITGADPVLPGERGDLIKMTDTWLRWGEERRLLP